MCLEDIRLGRQQTARVSQVRISAASLVQLCGSDEMRTKLILGIDGAVQIWYGPLGLTPANGSGYTLLAQWPIIELKIEDWGKLLTGPWQAFAQVGGAVVSVTEVGLEKT